MRIALSILNIIITRCQWCEGNPLYVEYHDNDWGVPVFDVQKQFESLTLEIFQAGLSWITILKKRENLRRAFDDFDYNKVALYEENKIYMLMKDSGIIRNRLKIEATINNAQCFIGFEENGKSFSDYIWSFINHKTVQNNYENSDLIPSQTSLSKVISDDLKKRGLMFVGPKIIYSHMQASGLVNNHLTSCFRHQHLKG